MNLSPIQNSQISPAKSEHFAEGLKRTGLGKFVDTRLDQNLASIYIADQFGSWQTRKVVNDEFHNDVVKKFVALPAEVQQSIARLAELRLAATTAIFSPEGLTALIEFGKTITPGQVPDLKKFIDEAAAGNGKLVIPALEKFMSQRCQLGSTGDFTYTEILLRIHHATWHANLDKPHDFAYAEDKLPQNANKGPISGKDYPTNLRLHSDKADTINVFTQLAALGTTFAITGAAPIYDMNKLNRTGVAAKSNSLLNSDWQSILASLDAGAIINN